MRTIALFLPNWIGDVVMATPAIRAVRARYPNAKLLAVCKPYVADTLGGSPRFDDVVPFDKRGPNAARFWSVVSRLRREATDAAILFPNSFRPALAAKFAGCTRIVGFARYGRDVLLTDRLYAKRNPDGRPKPMPIVDDYNRLAEMLGADAPGHNLELFATPEDERRADAFLHESGLLQFDEIIGLNPGGAFGASKHWPTESFAKVARDFAKDRSRGVVVLCGPSEREEARTIAALAGLPNVVPMSDTALSIGLTKAIVRRLRLLIATDSGPRHFAAAFGVPVVTLFGPTHIGWTETYYAKAVHLQEAVPCGPCQQRVCPLGHHRCMTELSPDKVVRTAQALLAHHTPIPRELRHAC